MTPRVGRREWDSNLEAVVRGLYYDFNLRKLNLDLHPKCVMGKTKEQTCKDRKIIKYSNCDIFIVIVTHSALESRSRKRSFAGYE